MGIFYFHLHRAGVLAPGLDRFETLRRACLEQQPIDTSQTFTLASPTRLPANERRRCSQSVRLILACLDQIAHDSPFALSDLRSVFATDDGVGEVSQQMLEILATTREVSPLVFPNSVHSATTGYFSIAYQNRQPSVVVSRGSDSFAAGLLNAVLESATHHQPVLLICFDPAMTSPLLELLPISQPTASVWLLGTGVAPNDLLGTFKLTLESEPSPATSLPAWIPTEWAHNCTARAYAALGLLASASGSFCTLPIGSQALRLELQHGAQT